MGQGQDSDVVALAELLRRGDWRLYFKFRNETTLEVVGICHCREANRRSCGKRGFFHNGFRELARSIQCKLRIRRRKPAMSPPKWLRNFRSFHCDGGESGN